MACGVFPWHGAVLSRQIVASRWYVVDRSGCGRVVLPHLPSTTYHLPFCLLARVAPPPYCTVTGTFTLRERLPLVVLLTPVTVTV